MISKVVYKKNFRSNSAQIKLQSKFLLILPVEVAGPAEHHQGDGGQMVDEHLQEVLG